MRQKFLTEIDRIYLYLKRQARPSGSVWSGRLDRLLTLRSRYLKYTFSKKFFPNREIKVKTFWGAPIKCVLPDHANLFLYGLFLDHAEIRLMKFLIKNLKPEGIFFDAGANIGFYTLLASNFIEPGKGSIHAFEPTPAIFEFLKVNCAGLSNVQINNVALSDQDGVAELALYSGESWKNSIVTSVPGTARVTVRTTTLDQYSLKNNVFTTFVKIDVEGAEDGVIQGSREILRRGSPTISLEIFPGEKMAQPYTGAMHALLRMGYEPYMINEAGDLEQISREHLENIEPLPLINYINLIFQKRKAP